MNNELNQENSLQLIQKMIETSKNNLRDNGIFFLLWGWLVLIASISHFILIKFGFEYSWIPWPILMIIGTIASVIIGIRIGKKSRVITYFDKMMIYLWYGFFFVVVLIIVMAYMDKISWEVAQPLIIAMYGMGTFVSGGVLKFKPLIIGGVLCWITSIVAFFVPYDFVLLIIAVSIIVSYLIPGYMLRAKKA